MLLLLLGILPEKALADTGGGAGAWRAASTGPKAGVWLPFFREDFESGALPPGWATRDSNADGQTWIVRPSAMWHITAMPPEPGNYLVSYDDDTLRWNPETEEELISPGIYISGYDTIRLIYGLGYQNFKGQDTLVVRARFHDGVDWGAWQNLAAYYWDVGSGRWDTIGLWDWLPAESLQLSFLWFDHTWLHWDWYAAVDNITLEYLLSLPVNLTASAILSPKALEEEGRVITPALRIRNTGNQSISDNITAHFLISDTSGTLYRDSKTLVGGIRAGDSVDLLFSPWRAGPLGGPYTATGFLSYRDSFPGDDTCRAEFGVIPDSVIRSIPVPYSPDAPAVDGVISPGEWNDAARWDASDYLARDGKTDYPGSFFILALHDGSFLYLAYEAVIDAQATDSAEGFVCLDDDASGSWPSHDTAEGMNRFINPNAWLCAWFKLDFTHGDWHGSGLSSFAFGQTNGHATFEAAIPMSLFDSGPQFLGANPVPDGDSVRAHLFYEDPVLGKIACWPQDLTRFYDPAGYGVLYLEPLSRADESAGTASPRLFAPSVVRGRAHLTLSLPYETELSLALYDATGRLTKEVFEGKMGPGVHDFRLELPCSGVYFLIARAGGWSAKVKVVSVKSHP
jgi:hypothetical protein